MSTQTSPDLKSANRDGVELRYIDTGSGDPPLVFIHGWCCNQAMWRDQIEAFAPRHRIIAVDLRGHGQSDKPDQDYDIAGFADDMAWLISEIGLDRPVLIGHSMGGVTALKLVREHPDIARAAVFVDAGIMPIPDEIRPLIGQTIEALKSPAYQRGRFERCQAILVPAGIAARASRRSGGEHGERPTASYAHSVFEHAFGGELPAGTGAGARRCS